MKSQINFIGDFLKSSLPDGGLIPGKLKETWRGKEQVNEKRTISIAWAHGYQGDSPEYLKIKGLKIIKA